MYSEILEPFETISLQQLDSENMLMKNRFESKYVFSLSLLDQVLKECVTAYNILEIGDNRVFRYYNCYFDTVTCRLFYLHHNGKSERFKIRKREYLDSSISFMEIKQKNKKGFSVKYRQEGGSPAEAGFLLKEHAAIDADSLLPMMENRYSRITLMHKQKTEKVTIDLNLNFESEKNKISFSNIVIAEVKSERFSSAAFASIMKSLGIREGGMSKYCLGMIALGKNVRHNLFNPSYKQILKKNADATK